MCEFKFKYTFFFLRYWTFYHEIHPAKYLSHRCVKYNFKKKQFAKDHLIFLSKISAFKNISEERSVGSAERKDKGNLYKNIYAISIFQR